MNISIDSKNTNALLSRTDVKFSIDFEGGVPSRKTVREALAAALSIPIERIVVVRLDGSFGSHALAGSAHVHPTAEAALKSEKKHLLIRDALLAKEEKKKEAKKAAGPAKK